MVLGIGDENSNPERMFVVPLKEIAKPFIHKNELKKYEKDMSTFFFYDFNKKELV